ncbi:MAG: hypothetical protein QXX08_04305 [Candidatus Bathyarchaeia archaeon]
MLQGQLESDFEQVCSDKSFLVFIDHQLNEPNGYLRSLPFVTRLSGGKVKRVVVWEPGRNCNKPLDLSLDGIDFVHPRDFSPINVLHCVIANDEKERIFGYVDKFVEFAVPSIFILSHGSFTPKAWEHSGKPLDSKTSIPPRHFETELNRYLDRTRLTEFQLLETKNLAFTEVCCFHSLIKSERVRTLVDLFDFKDDILTISPIWDWATNLLKLLKENTVANIHAFVFNALRPLIERNKDVSKVSNCFESFIRQCNYDSEILAKIRHIGLKKNFGKYKDLLRESYGSIFGKFLNIQMERLKCQ